MRKTSPPGTNSKSSGYVLLEAIALLLVISIGVTSIVATASRMMLAVSHQARLTSQIIQDRNEQALSHMHNSANK